MAFVSLLHHRHREWWHMACILKPPNRIKFYGRLIVSLQKRWSTMVDHWRSDDLPIIWRIRLWFIVIVSIKNIYSLSDRNIILLSSVVDLILWLSRHSFFGNSIPNSVPFIFTTDIFQSFEPWIKSWGLFKVTLSTMMTHWSIND